jgi:hypothetical protein
VTNGKITILPIVPIDPLDYHGQSPFREQILNKDAQEKKIEGK